jgi:hypothetical protein
MIQPSIRTLSKITFAALFAVSTATAIVATQAANPAEVGSPANVSRLAATSMPAAAQGVPNYRRGWYSYHGRYWQHRRWHAGYWGPAHRWHAGFWTYF